MLDGVAECIHRIYEPSDGSHIDMSTALLILDLSILQYIQPTLPKPITA